jgi:AcrR family transcriptional regulator
MDSTKHRQAARSQAARNRITQAALTVFALKGYAAASIDDVCLAAGTSKGGLYHHFPNKSAVLAGVVDRLAQIGALRPPFEPGEAGGSLSARAIGQVLIEIWAEASRDEALRDRLRVDYEASIDHQLREPASDGLRDILRMGALIQLLTRGDALDAGEAARRLGIERAA